MTVTASKPDIGQIVQDTKRNRTGLVMGHEGPYVQLRPVGGGREWDADPQKLRPLTAAEALKARKAARPRWCNWHEGLSDSTVLVQVHEAASGPGGHLYACAKCRVAHNLTPMTEQVI